MVIFEVFETEEDDEALEKEDTTDIFTQEAQGNLTVENNNDDFPSKFGAKIRRYF